MSTFAELVPEGTDPPPDIPAPIFQAALGAFLDERRLDMQALAAEVGISRATLYRRVGDRDHLLGAVLWFLTRHAIARAVSFNERRRGAPVAAGSQPTFRVEQAFLVQRLDRQGKAPAMRRQMLRRDGGRIAHRVAERRGQRFDDGVLFVLDMLLRPFRRSVQHPGSHPRAAPASNCRERSRTAANP